MKRFLLLILVLLGLGFFILRQQVINILSYSQCDQPIPYRIGQIDPGFNLSNAQVTADISQATSILSNAEKKSLFIYADTAPLTVTFVYDTRAALSNQINQQQVNLNLENAALKQQINDYETSVSQFKQKLSDFNAIVGKYNREGGAPPDAYKSLNEQQRQLRAEAESLNQTARQLNLSTQDYNVGVSNINNDSARFNSEIKQKPEEGLYDEATNTITMYFADNQNELVHTLAHEFGHALGMQHGQNPQAIMYPYSSTSLTITPEDMAQLNIACRKEFLPKHLFTVFQKWVARSKQQ